MSFLESSDVASLIKNEAAKGQDKSNITANDAKKKSRAVLFFSDVEKNPPEKLDPKQQRIKHQMDELLALEEKLRGKNFISFQPIKPVGRQEEQDSLAPKFDRKRSYHKSYLANDLMHLVHLTEVEKKIQKRSASKQ